MSWLLFAFCGPVLWAASTHLDKYLVERYFKRANVATLLVFTALTGLLALPLIGFWRPQVIQLPPSDVAILMFAGLLYMGALFFYLQALQGDEASVIAPFFQASPLFAYVLGFAVLDERLSATQIAAGALIVGGTALVSVRFGATKRLKARLVVLMLACALCMALNSLIFKIFAVRDEFWTTTFWTFAGQGLFGCLVLAIPARREEFFRLLRANTSALLTINAVNELVNLAGTLGARYALMLAPLSLVQAVTSTTTLFVFAFGVVLTLACPALGREDLSAVELAKKGFAAVLVAAGVILIAR
jgi:drug/metabolite transporter (DMT)-like permease